MLCLKFSSELPVKKYNLPYRVLKDSICCKKTVIASEITVHPTCPLLLLYYQCKRKLIGGEECFLEVIVYHLCLFLVLINPIVTFLLFIPSY